MTNNEPTPALWPTAHQAILAGQSPAIPGVQEGEKDQPLIVPVAVMRHTYDPWTGKCGCGEGPFLVSEHAAHVRALIGPPAPTSEQP